MTVAELVEAKKGNSPGMINRISDELLGRDVKYQLAIWDTGEKIGNPIKVKMDAEKICTDLNNIFFAKSLGSFGIGWYEVDKSE